jgi:hypothetical protein
VTISVTTKAWGSEVSVLVDGNVEPFGFTQGSMGSNQEYTSTACLALGQHTLTLVDSYGDGWHGGYVTIGDTRYGEDFTSGYQTAFTFNVIETPDCIDTPITVVTRNYGGECSVLVDGHVDIYGWTTGSLSSWSQSTRSHCLPPGQHTLQLKDSYGDGWHNGYVTINGQNYGLNFLSGRESPIYHFTVG